MAEQNGKRRRRWPWMLLGLVVVGAAAAGIAWLTIGKPPEDVSNPDVEFTEPKPPPAEKPFSRITGFVLLRGKGGKASFGPSAVGSPPQRPLRHLLANATLGPGAACGNSVLVPVLRHPAPNP
jgi:hypothetical protein